jgi:hypothetical protein
MEVQRFLEQYPSLVPGAFNITGGESGHPPKFWGLISQPILPSYHGYIPDFMWISKNSSYVQPVFIEIESPIKKYFGAGTVFSANFNQALSQLEDWKVWISDPTNQIKFRDFYGLNDEPYKRLSFFPAFVLIYGRRKELYEKPIGNKRRHEKEKDDLFIMSYDRLHPRVDWDQFACLKVKEKNGASVISVVSVPETFTLSSTLADVRSNYLDLDKAISNNENIPPQRRDFLIRRLEYWNNWINMPKNNKS